MNQHKLIFPIIVGFVLASSVLGGFGLMSEALAAPTETIIVDTSDDELNTDNDCSLREAIQAANTDSPVDNCPAGSGADTILLPPGAYQLTLNPDGTPDDNADGDLDIWSTLTIQGGGEENTFIQAGSSLGTGIDRVLHLIDGNANLKLNDLTVRYGSAYGYGGGIHNLGELTLENVTVISNTVVAQDTPGVEGRGGGLYSTNLLRISDSTIRGNRNTIDGSMVVDTGEVCGAGIYNEGSLEITNTLVISNNTPYTGAGIFNAGGTLDITDTQVLSNTAGGMAGIYIYAGTAEIHFTDVANNICTEFDSCGIRNNGALTLTNSTVSANHGYLRGAGIYNTGQATIVDSAIMSNTTQSSGSGGGIYNSGGDLYLSHSKIYTNTALGGGGGGIYNASGSTASISSCAVYDNWSTSAGGGISNYGGTLDIINSTIFANKNAHSTGGGIANLGTLAITNTTLSGNAALDGDGGGIGNSGYARLVNATLSGNSSPSAGGGVANSGAFVMTNTIVTQSSGGDCSGTISGANNLIDNDTDCPSAGSLGAVTNFDPLLGDHGGDTLTHALLSGSNAIDVIATGSVNCIAGSSTDQRGAVRAGGVDRGGDACDIGAYEVSDQAPSAISLREFATQEGAFPSSYVLGVLIVVALAVLSIRRYTNSR